MEDLSFEELLDNYEIVDKDLEKKERYNKDKKKDYIYLGLRILTSEDKKTGNIYYTVVNPKNNYHVHTFSHSQAKEICKCYRAISINASTVKFNRIIRCKAIKLFGNKVVFRN